MTTGDHVNLQVCQTISPCLRRAHMDVPKAGGGRGRPPLPAQTVGSAPPNSEPYLTNEVASDAGIEGAHNPVTAQRSLSTTTFSRRRDYIRHAEHQRAEQAGPQATRMMKRTRSVRAPGVLQGQRGMLLHACM